MLEGTWRYGTNEDCGTHYGLLPETTTITAVDGSPLPPNG